MTKMTSWQKKYHELYLSCKTTFDPHVVRWITEKEAIIAAVPLANPFLKYELSGIRKYKGGKLRILYALSTEKQELWDCLPESCEILFLYVDLRSDDTYKDALKLLRKHTIA